MKALINPNQPILDGYYVVEVVQNDFPVASPLFWTDCDDTVVAYEYYYDPANQQIVQIPLPPANQQIVQIPLPDVNPTPAI